MTRVAIHRLRLAAQGIAAPRAVGPSEVVTHLGAIQAQDYPGALWSIALRTPACTRADVERAIAERHIVRTWPMRGTLHFVPAADARWMLELLAPRVMRSTAARHRQLGLDDRVFRRSRTLIARALKRDPVLPRSAVFDVLEKGGVATTGQRGIHIVQRLCLERMLCFGAHAGKQPTFTSFDEWIATSRQLARDEALRTLAERYFTSHGPATLRDFAGWTGLAVADAKIGLQLAQPSLARIGGAESELWMSPALSSVTAPASLAHLLPGFDELLLGYKDRSATLRVDDARHVASGSNGMFQATLVLDGRVCGLWRRTERAKGVQIDASPFAPLKPSQKKAFAAAAERYGRYLGLPAAVSWTR